MARAGRGNVVVGGGYTLEVQGLDQLQRALNKAAREMDDQQVAGQIADAHQRVAEVVARRARQIAPVRTGKLRASIRGTRQKRFAVVKAGGARVKHVMVRVRKHGGGWSAPIPAEQLRNREVPTEPAGVVFYAAAVHAKDPFLVKAAHQTQSQWVHEYLNAVMRACHSIGEVHRG